MADSEQPAPVADENTDPGFASVQKFLLYGLSLPERMLRSTTALVGGALRESTALLVPQAFQSSQTYSMFVKQMLDFMVVNVGGVEPPPATSSDPQQAQVENFVARKAVGNFVELAGIATLHLSPLTVLAVVSDLAYGSKTYLKELSEELKKNGVIDANSTIDQASDLLAAVSKASGVTAQAFNTPPLSVDGLQQTIQQTREAVAGVDPTKLIPQAEIDRLWKEMHTLSQREGVSLFGLSSAMTMYTLNKVGHVGQGALSTVVVMGNMFDRHILEHYANSLETIQEKGFYSMLSESSRPYLDATWQNFSTDKPTVTEDLLTGKLLGKAWGGICGLFGNREK